MMTTFPQFCANCKMRHDFGDQIQVRYRHSNGEDYDTWVSGEEVLGRIRSGAAEKRLRGLLKLNWQEIQGAKERLPDEVKEKSKSWLLDILADGLEDNLGGNLIGDNLANSIRGEKDQDTSGELAKERWTTLLHDENFRAGVLELAWIQLEGSFPEDRSAEEPDDWI
jgi:hypothetical protein